MKPQTRPFTVEIKSSRKPVQKAIPVRPEPPRVVSTPPDLWSTSVLEGNRDRTPASLAALEEANRAFAKLVSRPTISATSSELSPSETRADGGDRVGSTVDEPKSEPLRADQSVGKRGSILPDLSSQGGLKEGEPPQVSEQRSGPRNPRRPQPKRL